MSDNDIGRLRNLGPVTQRHLSEIGITTEAQLRALGAPAAYAQLKFTFGKAISLNALWALAAALDGVDWRSLSDDTKARLKREAGVE